MVLHRKKMGNNCCAARESDGGANFDKKEQKALKEMFSNLTNSDPEFYILFHQFY